MSLNTGTELTNEKRIPGGSTETGSMVGKTAKETIACTPLLGRSCLRICYSSSNQTIYEKIELTNKAGFRSTSL